MMFMMGEVMMIKLRMLGIKYYILFLKLSWGLWLQMKWYVFKGRYLNV